MSQGGIDKNNRRLAGPGLVGQSRWTGTTNIASGDSNVIITAAQVKSGDIILHNLGVTTVASHRDLITSPNSITDDTSFILNVQNAVIDTQEVVYTIINKS